MSKVEVLVMELMMTSNEKNLALIPNFGDEIVNEWITKQHYVFTDFQAGVVKQEWMIIRRQVNVKIYKKNKMRDKEAHKYVAVLFKSRRYNE